MKDKWLEDISDKLADFRQPVPDGLWEQIEPAVIPRRAFFGRGAAWRAAACVALAVAVALVLFLPRDEEAPLLMAVEETPAPPHSGLAIAESEPDALPEPVTAYRPGVPSGSFIARNPVQAVPEAEETVPEEKSLAMPEEPAGKEADTVTVSRERFILPSGEGRGGYAYAAPKKNHGSRFSVAMSVSNLGSKTGAGYAPGDMPMADAVESGAPIFPPMTQIIMSSKGMETVSRSKHYQPLSAGLSVSFGLTDRLSITTGLVYSRLYSEFRTGNDAARTETNQTMHYLGVPVRLNFDLWRNDRFRVYGSGGGMIEKAVKGRAVTRYYVDNALLSGDKSTVSEHRPQFSVTAAAGAEMLLVQPLGLYAEPGMTYYIGNGTGVQNFYKDKPFNFTFQFGLRLRF